MSDRVYEHPLVSRYASAEMSYLFSPHKKFSTWRRLWVALAEAERELGLDITEAQIAELREAIDDILRRSPGKICPRQRHPQYDGGDRYRIRLPHQR